MTREEIQRAADQVVGHLLSVHGYWISYRKLFHGNEQSQPVLAAVASEFFWLLERALKAALLQGFRLFTDPPQSLRKNNASFRGLLLAIAGPNYVTQHADLLAHIEKVDSQKTIREHINRYIAHLDLPLLAQSADPPQALALDEVESALEAARAFMDGFMARFFDEEPFDFKGKAEAILPQIDNMVEILRTGLANRPPN